MNYLLNEKRKIRLEIEEMRTRQRSAIDHAYELATNHDRQGYDNWLFSSVIFGEEIDKLQKKLDRVHALHTLVRFITKPFRFN